MYSSNLNAMYYNLCMVRLISKLSIGNVSIVLTHAVMVISETILYGGYVTPMRCCAKMIYAHHGVMVCVGFTLQVLNGSL